MGGAVLTTIILTLAGCGARSRDQPPCEDHDCGDNATCVERDGEAHCQCDDGYEDNGEGCIVLCPLGCWGHGACRVNGDDEPECECDTGYHLLGSTACVSDEEEPFPNVCSDSGFCWDHPLPQGNPLMTVWAFSGDDVWAAGSGGVVIHWDGERWSGTFEGVQGNLSSRTEFSTRFDDMWGSSSSDMWVTGRRQNGDGDAWENEIRHWDGSSWSSVSIPLTDEELVNSVFGFAPDDVWFVGLQGLCVHWDGEQGTRFDLDTTENLSDLWGSASDDLWAVGAEGAIFHWDGEAWSETAEPDGGVNIAIWGTSPRDAWIVGSEGLARHWDGTSWTTVDTGHGDVHLGRIWGSDEDDYWAVSGDPWAAHDSTYHWDGHTWTPVEIDNGQEHIMGVHGVDRGDAWAVTDRRGRILRWNGEAWHRLDTRVISPALDEGLHDLWPGGEGSDPWVVGYGGVMMRRGQRAWELVESDTTETLNTVYAVGPDNVWVGDENRTIAHWDGSGWTSYDVGRWVSDLWGVSDHLWAVVGNGVQEFTGDSWFEPDCSERCTQVRMIAGTNENDILALDHDGRTRHFDGESWTQAVDESSPGGHYSCLTCIPDESCFTVQSHDGTIFRWNDGEWQFFEEIRIDAARFWAESESSLWAVGRADHWGVIQHWDGTWPPTDQLWLGGMTWEFNVVGSRGQSPLLWLWGTQGDILRREL